MKRLTQLRALPDETISRIVATIQHARTIPHLRAHFEKHRRSLGVADEQSYLRAFLDHLSRPDLRVFTYLRSSDDVPFWELVAPDTGSTVLYNEVRQRIWSFFHPEDADARMVGVRAKWIEVLRTPTGWEFEERWTWRP